MDWPSVKTNFRKPRSASERAGETASAGTNIQLNPVIGYTDSPGILVNDTRKSPLKVCGHAAAALSGEASTNAPFAFCTSPIPTGPVLAVFNSAYPMPPGVSLTSLTMVGAPCAVIPFGQVGEESAPIFAWNDGLLLERKSV